jgi:hypothetical protein
MDKRGNRVFWLSGPVGTGKSAIAHTIAEIGCFNKELLASFFCSRDFKDRSDLQVIFPTLAFQLAHQNYRFKSKLLDLLRAKPDVGRWSLSSKLEKLIVGPLKENRTSTLIIIDALDECEDKQPVSTLLSVLSRYVHEIPNVRFFITGRPESPIRAGFRLEALRPITVVLNLHDVERPSVNEDIRLYFRTCLTEVKRRRRGCKFQEEWPSSFDIEVLCNKTAGIFTYASRVIEFIASEHHLPAERLDLILRSRDAAHERWIDFRYSQTLKLAFRDAISADQELHSQFRIIVGAVLLVFHPLSRKALSDLLGNCGTPSHISTILLPLHSLLDVPDGQDDPIRPFHESFTRFLTDRTRCKDKRFFIDTPALHKVMLFSCLDLMKGRLRKNICDLDDYAVLSEVENLSARRETSIGSSLEYACRFWTRHLVCISVTGPHAERVQGEINEFFTKYLLCWIEVLSIAGYLDAAVHAINNIRRWFISVS